MDRWCRLRRVETYPGVEFNLRNDISAANVVYDSGITVWQVPSNVYSQVSVSYTELEEKIGGTSKLADYLINQMVEWNRTTGPNRSSHARWGIRRQFR